MSETGLTRREALKRGALVAGAVWAIPMIQAVGMRPAYAQTTSAECHVYCIRWNQQNGTWEHMPGGQLMCPHGALEGKGTCLEQTVVHFNNVTGELTFTFPDSCRFETGDPSPDGLDPQVGYVTCQTNDNYSIPLSKADNPLTVAPNNGHAIQQVDLIIKCCCG